MTGKELIVYILTNNLENKELDVNGDLLLQLGFLNEEKMAAAFGIDIPAIRVMYSLGMISGINICGKLYFSSDATPKPYSGGVENCGQTGIHHNNAR